jgi:DNA-binding protein VF530
MNDLPDLPDTPEPEAALDAAKEATSDAQARNPLHGLTLERIVTELSEHYGWDGLGQRITLRCFTSEPSVASSLKFLRKTPWAREKVESLYLFMLREKKRGDRVPPRPKGPARGAGPRRERPTAPRSTDRPFLKPR